VLLEPLQVRGVGTVPGVDGLVGVAHDAEIGSAPEPPAQQSELERVDVLELVDEEVAEPPVSGGRVLGVGGQVPRRQAEEVVEVDEAPLALPVGEVLPDPGDLVGFQGWPTARRRGCGCVVVRFERACRGPLDLCEHVERECGVAAPPRDEPCQESELAVEELGRTHATFLPPLPELGVGDGVERPGVDRRARQEPVQAVAEFARSLPRERHGERALRRQREGGTSVGDPMREHTRLARAGAGEHTEVPGRIGDRPGLFRVQAAEQPGGGRIGLAVGSLGHGRVGLHAPDRTSGSRQLRRVDSYAPEMGYDEKLLYGDEQIVVDTHPSWIMMIRSVLYVLGATVVGIVLLNLGGDGWFGSATNYIAVLLIVLALLHLAQRFVKWYSTNFVITTERCIYREGIVS
jgi:hypothetical protein